MLEGRTIVQQGEGASPSVLLGDTEPASVNVVDPTRDSTSCRTSKSSRIADEIFDAACSYLLAMMPAGR